MRDPRRRKIPGHTLDVAISSDTSPRRLAAIDALRGLVIVLMALDHARDFFHVSAMTGSPTDLTQTTTAVFLTRWVTHLCAPTFALLAGLGAWLRLQRPGETRSSLARYLVSRGIGLVVLELTVMRLAMNVSWSPAHPVLLLVLWMLGLSMVVLAALLWVPNRMLLAASVVVMAAHHGIDGVRAADLGAWAGAWRILHEPGVVVVRGIVAVVGYPLIPWVAVMTAGFAIGPWFAMTQARRQRRLVRVGLTLCLAFVLVRWANMYGDPVQWTAQATGTFTVLAFLNTTKYPPSLGFLLMTLGPALLMLGWMERRGWQPGHPLVVLGRVPLFFYVSHFVVLHALAAALALALYGPAAQAVLQMPVPSMGGPATAFPEHFGHPLWVTYVAWAAVIALLWPACQWLAGARARAGGVGAFRPGEAGRRAPPSS